MISTLKLGIKQFSGRIWCQAETPQVSLLTWLFVLEVINATMHSISNRISLTEKQEVSVDSEKDPRYLTRVLHIT